MKMINKTTRILFCCALALTLVSFAAAEDQFNSGGLQGAKTDHGQMVVPLTSVYSNCGAGCKNYNTNYGYWIAGVSSPNSPGQTIAVSFTPKKAAKLTKVIEANSCYDSNGDCNGNLMARILADSSTGPGKILASLKQTGNIPIWTSSAPITYKAKKPVALKANKKYWLCQQINPKTPSVAGFWMASNSDTSSDLYYQDTGSCKSTAWNSANGTVRPAFEIN